MHYAKHYKTGAPMPAELMEKIKKSRTFNKGYDMTELVAAAELDMHWHMLGANAPFRIRTASSATLWRRSNCGSAMCRRRYRSSYFNHIWSGDYAAGYYAYLWTQMLADDAYQGFVDKGWDLTRANRRSVSEDDLVEGQYRGPGDAVCRLARRPATIDDVKIAYAGAVPPAAARVQPRGPPLGCQTSSAV